MKTNIQAPPLRNIRITDPLFGHYAALVSAKIVPYQWEILNDRVSEAEQSCCIRNFRIAAGEQSGEHGGPVFCDSDAYKWLETVAYCIENGSGAAFQETADSLIDLVGRAQQPDGYLNTYYTIAKPEGRWQNLTEGHELYCAGHLIEAAVAYYRATGKDALLNIAARFADLIAEKFGPGETQYKGYPGHQEIELALVRLYRVTGKQNYLDLARHFLRERGKAPNYLLEELERNRDTRIFPEFADYDDKYAQSHGEPVNQTTAEGHAVRALYMYSAMADIALECGDDSFRYACRTLYRNITGKRMYITGGLGSSGHLERFTADYDLPNDRMYCESCASVGLMMFGQRMAALTRDARYYDAVERALCNTVLAGISREGDRYFYVNPLEVWPENCLPSTAMQHVKPLRQPWYHVACCPTNIARTLASLGQYIFAEDGKSIYINQFISADLDTALQGMDLRVSVQSALLTEGAVQITVEASEPKPFTLRVRIPDYIEGPVFTLDGKAIAPAVEDGYAVLAVSRAGRQTFRLTGTVKPRLVAANPAVRADAGRLALMFGPYVYCLEEQDNGANLAACFVSPDAAGSLTPPTESLPGTLPGISLPGKRLERSTAEPESLYGAPDFVFADVTLSAVPYCLWGNRTPGEMQVWHRALLS